MVLTHHHPLPPPNIFEQSVSSGRKGNGSVSRRIFSECLHAKTRQANLPAACHSLLTCSNFERQKGGGDGSALHKATLSIDQGAKPYAAPPSDYWSSIPVSQLSIAQGF
jgi:hypothetical protein